MLIMDIKEYCNILLTLVLLLLFLNSGYSIVSSVSSSFVSSSFVSSSFVVDIGKIIETFLLLYLELS
jgi:hypothetical protein